MKARPITAENAARAVAAFRRKVSSAVETGDAVRPILERVRAEGDRAVLDFTERFDGARLRRSDLRVGAGEIERGWRNTPPSSRKAIRSAVRSIRDYHRKCLPRDWTGRSPDGLSVGERFHPLRRVGLYVPGGRVPLVSTVLMTAVPAQVAGVGDIVVCTPPQENGAVSDGLLAAFHALGLSEVYRAGGAQAIGAMAFGTRTIPAVDLVAGPGNAYVMEAKRQVYGTVGVDLLPGPSEVMVVADGGADPALVALDLLSQAEHGTGKEKLFLALPDRRTWDRVREEIRAVLDETPGSATMAEVVRSRTLAGICADEDAMVAFANEVAPEHLELHVAPGSITRLTRRITTAGAILQGYATPTVLGDFVAGPSHTLPTDGTGRFSGGLQVVDFMRRTSVVRSNAPANRRVLPAVEAFGEMESLPVHVSSLRRRVAPLPR
ncbi:MAG: histidinol dehydrogenase [Puniceicoccaceae bacterium]